MIKLNLEMKDAHAFFGNKTRIAEVLGITPSAVSQWGNGLLLQENAFKLAFISKLPKYRRQGKLKYELIIE